MNKLKNSLPSLLAALEAAALEAMGLPTTLPGQDIIDSPKFCRFRNRSAHAKDRREKNKAARASRRRNRQ